MLGIEDGWVAAAYILCIASTALCIVYSIIKRNQTDEDVGEADIRWEKEEKEVEENL
ncbi:MAG: symporter small accessory protein [Verrucomicrobiia bacterium]